MPTRIIIFEDDEPLRASMKVLFNGVEEYVVVGDFGNGVGAGKAVVELDADVAILDIEMPGIDGIEALQLMKSAKPEMSIIMHTVFEDDKRLFDSLCAGASGYLLKNSSFVQLIHAIEEVRNGGAPMSPVIARKVLDSFKSGREPNQYGLSKKEVEVLQYLVKGFSYKMIAAALHITISTVQAHIRNIYTKLHVNCGREAVVLALKEKII